MRPWQPQPQPQPLDFPGWKWPAYVSGLLEVPPSLPELGMAAIGIRSEFFITQRFSFPPNSGTVLSRFYVKSILGIVEVQNLPFKTR